MQQTSEAAIAICTEKGFGGILALATRYRGSALAEQGQIDEGIGRMRRSGVAQLATGQAYSDPVFFTCWRKGKTGQRGASGRIGYRGRGDRNSGNNG